MIIDTYARDVAVNLTFDFYIKVSLKQASRTSRKGKKFLHVLDILITHRGNSPSNKTEALTKSMNMTQNYIFEKIK